MAIKTKELLQVAHKLNKDLPHNWKTVQVKDFAEVLNGGAFKSELFNKTKGLQIIRIRDLIKRKNPTYYDGEYSETYLINSGDFLIGMDGDFVGVEWKNGKALLNQRVCKVSVNNKLFNERFFRFGINRYLQKIHSVTSYVTVAHLSSETILHIEFPLPPINEQQRIVSKFEVLFSELDSAQDKLQKVKLQLDEYRQSFLKSAFEGKLTEEWRKQNPYDIKNVQKNENIPKGWYVCYLEDLLIKINSGFPSGKHNKSQNGIPHIRPMNINENGNIDLSVVKYVEDNSKDKLLKNDVLFNNTNSPKLLGKTALIKENTNWGYSNHMTRIRLDNSLVESSWIAIFLHKLFKNGFYKQIAKNHVNQSSVNSTDLSKKIPILVAPLDEQKQIISQIERIFSLIDNTKNITNSMLKQLETLRSSILKQGFEGKLVPQDLNDESSEKLLERIKVIKQSLTKSLGKK